MPTAAVLFILGVPVAGLTIDVGLLYMIQSRLQAAVDAGALAGARSLARGDNSTAQVTNAQNAATAYVNANFPAGYLGSTNLLVATPNVNTTNALFRTVSVSASVNTPHLFLRWFGGTFTTVNAAATATRRDVNIVMVMDRSNSLDISGACNPLKAAAVDFVNKFSEGRDYVGLVTFAVTYSLVVTPSQTFRTNMTNSINAIVCEGATNSPSGLWLGYRALADLNQPSSLNVILFFTDGRPTAVSADFAIKSTSGCTNKSNRIGVPTADEGGTQIKGLMNTVPVSPVPVRDSTPAPLSSGCAYASSWDSNRWRMNEDVTGIPSTDIFGNSLTFAYRTVSATGGLLPATNTSTNVNNFLNGAANATVHAAVRIRQPALPGTGAAALPNVVIFSIGLGDVDSDLLQYVANDPANAARFDNTKPAGKYVYAANAGELAAAFNSIASEILRLAQ
jgi:Flp pilus assembly protein TadG